MFSIFPGFLSFASVSIMRDGSGIMDLRFEISN